MQPVAVELEIPCLPPSANSLYDRRQGRPAITEEYRAFRNEVFYAFRNSREKPIKGLMSLAVVYFLHTGDTSNRIKALEDSLQHAGVFENDKDIVDVYATRVKVGNKKSTRTVLQVAPYLEDLEERTARINEFIERVTNGK